jgi:hypothetical protein
MGVEPTAACSAQPATSFEDWGIHRDTTTPTKNFTCKPEFPHENLTVKTPLGRISFALVKKIKDLPG